MSGRIRVRLNGREVELPAGATLLDALALLEIAPDQKGVAVALGLDVVRRADWGNTELADGADVEVVTAAQGG